MVHSNYLGDDPTKERNMKEGKKKRRNEERQEGPYKGAEGTRELVVALVPERKQTNKPRKAQTVTHSFHKKFCRGGQLECHSL